MNIILLESVLGSIAAGIECEFNGNEPVSHDLVLKKIDTIEKQISYE